MKSPTDRRRFLTDAAIGATAAALLPSAVRAAEHASDKWKICAFEKFLQDLSFDELADVIAELGFAGIEATVRRKGHIEPADAEQQLPKMVDALAKRDLKVTIMATDVTTADDPLTERVLKTAADLGITDYRMGFYRYDLKQPITEQLDALRPTVEKLAQLNDRLGIRALYQNHSAPKYLGATIWDLYLLIRDIPVQQIASAFDIRHATIEAGLSWPIYWDVMRRHVGAVYVKDFIWDGPKARHAELGEGRVDEKFFNMVEQSDFDGPISLHVEYLPKGTTEENIAALRRDLKVLRGWLDEA